MAVGNEKELVIYARVENFDGIEKAVVIERQEQYLIKSGSTLRDCKGGLRVRKSTVGEVITFSRALKVKQADSGEASLSKENEEHCDEAYFEMFKAIAPTGIIKVRHKFSFKAVKLKAVDKEVFCTIPGLLLEVDCYPIQNTEVFHEWVRIELELEALEKEMAKYFNNGGKYELKVNLSVLPFKVLEFFTEADATPEQVKKLDQLFADVFKRPN